MAANIESLPLKIRETLREVAQLVGSSRCGWLWLNRTSDRFVAEMVVEWVPPNEPSAVGARYTQEEFPQTMETLLSDDVVVYKRGADDDLFPDVARLSKQEGYREYVLIPAWYEGELRGLMNLDFEGTPDVPDDLISELRVLTNLIGAALIRAGGPDGPEARRREWRHQRLISLGSRTSEVAHDFNNILQVVLVAGEFMKTMLDKSHPLYEFADDLIEAAESGRDLSDRLLLFGRDSGGGRHNIAIAGVLEDAVRFASRVLPPEIDVEFQDSGDLGTVFTSRTELQQAVVNLITNAGDAMKRGVVRVWAERIESLVLPRGEGPAVRITVNDTGAGMNSEQMRRAFEPFFTSKEPGRGTGLGLTIVQALADREGGSVEIASEEGVGTRVELVLPCGGPADTDSEARSAIAGGDEKILLVEDHLIVRRVARSALQRVGYDVVVASTDDEALELMENEEVELMVCEARPGRGDAAELLRRGRGVRPDLSAIFVTAQADLPDSVGSEVTSRCRVLRKPYSAYDLQRAVRSLLDA